MTSILARKVSNNFIPKDKAHDFLCFDMAAKAHSHGLRFDFHLHHRRPQKEMLDVFTEFLTKEIPNYQTLDPKTGLQSKNHKWRVVSALQKCIRRGDAEFARRCGSALMSGGEGDKLWHRLGVIAIEDVGLANPYLVSMVMMLSTRKGLRSQIGPRVTAFWAIDQLCFSAKSRDLTDLAVNILIGDPKDEIAFVKGIPKPLAVFADPGQSIMQRSVAHFAMFNKGIGLEKELPIRICSATDRAYAYGEIGLPTLLRYMCEKPSSAYGECLGAPVPFIWALMCESNKMKTRKDPFYTQSVAIIQRLPAPAYDQFTFEGKRAVSYFMKSCSDVKVFLDNAGVFNEEHRRALIYEAMFYTEGGSLGLKRLDYDGWHSLFKDLLTRYMMKYGLSGEEETFEFCDLMYNSIDDLNHARRRILS